MDFLSAKFGIFLLITAFINYIFKGNIRIAALLLASFVFYFVGAKEYVILLLALCLITYLFGLLLNKFKKRIFYILGACTILLALVYFKYTAFLLDLLKQVSMNAFTFEIGKIIAPLGISFMTFQAISYLGDIYYGKIEAEKSPLTVALFVCFFPNVTSGPIQKAKNFLPMIKEKAIFDYTLVRHGLMLFAFGALQKFYISDKLAPMINSMQAALLQEEHGGFHYMFFAFVYAIYLYSNFNSYSDMAIGIAEMLGLRYSENFKRPYLSQSIKEFWQRWHISLNSWFVDYVYIPLGGSRKGKVRYYINIMIVFFLSGLWHGASLHFIAWGLLNGIYQIVGNLTANIRKKIYERLKINVSSKIVVAFKRLCVFYLISISWIYFTIPGVKNGSKMIAAMICPSLDSLLDGWILGQFESKFSALAIACTIIIFAAIQIMREKQSLSKLIGKKAIIVRYAIYVAVVVLLLFGYFGTFSGVGNGGFVYGNF